MDSTAIRKALLSAQRGVLQDCGSACLREAKVNPMTPLNRVSRLGIAQRGRRIDVTRLGLHICYCRARV